MDCEVNEFVGGGQANKKTLKRVHWFSPIPIGISTNFIFCCIEFIHAKMIFRLSYKVIFVFGPACLD